MLEDPKLSSMIWWTRSSGHSQHANNADFNAFTLRPNKEFSECLKLYFKHGNVASLVRQLHMYGFHKVMGDAPSPKDPASATGPQAAWSFTHSSGLFRKGDEISLNQIKRRPGLSGGKRHLLKTYVAQSFHEQHGNQVLHGLMSPMPSFSNGVVGSLAGNYPRHQLAPQAYLAGSPVTHQQNQPRCLSSMSPYYQSSPSSYYSPQDRYPMSFSPHVAHPCHCASHPRFNSLLTIAPLTYHTNLHPLHNGPFFVPLSSPLQSMLIHYAADLDISARPKPDRMYDHGCIQAPYPYVPRDTGFARESPAFVQHPQSFSNENNFSEHRSLPALSMSSAPSRDSLDLNIGDSMCTNKDYSKVSTPPVSPFPQTFGGTNAPRFPSLPRIGAKKIDLPLDSTHFPLALNHAAHDVIESTFEPGEINALGSDSSPVPGEYSAKRVTVPSLLA